MSRVRSGSVANSDDEHNSQDAASDAGSDLASMVESEMSLEADSEDERDDRNDTPVDDELNDDEDAPDIADDQMSVATNFTATLKPIRGNTFGCSVGDNLPSTVGPGNRIVRGDISVTARSHREPRQINPLFAQTRDARKNETERVKKSTRTSHDTIIGGAIWNIADDIANNRTALPSLNIHDPALIPLFTGALSNLLGAFGLTGPNRRST